MDDRTKAIRDYIHGRLNLVDQNKIELLIANQPDWQEEYTLQLELREAISQSEVRRTVQTLKNHELQGKKKLKFKRFIFVLILITLAATIYVLLLQYWERPQDNETLYATYFEPLSNQVAPVTRNDGLDSLDLAFFYYDAGNYSDAFELMTTIEGNYNIRQIPIYRAVALMNLSKFNEALLILENVDIEDEPWKSYTMWYRALCLLNSNNRDQVSILLNQLIDSTNTPNSIRQKVKDLLQDL